MPPAALLGDLVESRGRLHQSRLRSQLASGRVAQGGGDRASYPGVDARGTSSGASKMSGVRRGAAEAALPAAGDERPRQRPRHGGPAAAAAGGDDQEPDESWFHVNTFLKNGANLAFGPFLHHSMVSLIGYQDIFENLGPRRPPGADELDKILRQDCGGEYKRFREELTRRNPDVCWRDIVP